MTDSDPDTIYVIERHDYDYEGPHRTRYAQSATTAIDLAMHEVEEHRAESWTIFSSDLDCIVLKLHPDDGSGGWVRIKEAHLHD